jgi:hypothetical protein
VNKTLKALVLVLMVVGTMGDPASQRRKREEKEQAIATIRQQQAHAPTFVLDPSHPPAASPSGAADGRGAREAHLLTIRERPC